MAKLLSSLPALALVVLIQSAQGAGPTIYGNNDHGAIAAVNQANDLLVKGDYDRAISLYTAALRRDSSLYLAHYWRGKAFLAQGKCQSAVPDFDAALRSNPHLAAAAIARAAAHAGLKRYDEALAELDHVIRLPFGPGVRAGAQNARAWLLATCPDRSVRNGKQAVADAKAACQFDSWNNWSYLDTLAAAYAEMGDFDRAMESEEKAISRIRDAGDLRRARERLDRLRSHKALRSDSF